MQKQDRKKELLFINCCITVHEESRTEKLARAFLGAYLKKHAKAEIEERNLDGLGLKTCGTADTVRKRNALSDAYAGKAAQEMTDGGLFLEAEKSAEAVTQTVMAAPSWEMSFPALLRIYIEHVSALNVTLGYGQEQDSREGCAAPVIWCIVRRREVRWTEEMIMAAII